MKIKAPRGTQDIIANHASLWQRIESVAVQLFNSYGLSEIRTPIFESTDLFKRSVGEDSDIVNKEMYTFTDRSDRSLTLRPEGTAGVVRSFIENALDRGPKPCKLWYRGPMFRYERPQTGRYRQFHQIGVEVFGSASPILDYEIIALAINLLDQLELKNLSLHINSIGNAASRAQYIDALKEFIGQHKDEVCEDCQRRLEQNPLRCLDCKVEADQKIYQNAPIIWDYFDEESKEHWSKIQELIKSLENDFGIEIVIDPKLVRGLDYYNHTVFEIKTKSQELGSQSTVLAGGRYDQLVKNLGGPEVPAFGWALGEERLAQLICDEQTDLSGVFILSDCAVSAAELAQKLRAEIKNEKIEFDYDSAKFKKQFDKALKNGYRWIVFYMEDERQKQKFKIKDLSKQEEKDELELEQVISAIYQSEAESPALAAKK